MLGHRPQHIYRAPRSNIRSNNLDIREKYIQQYLKKYGCEDIINDFKTLVSFSQSTRDGKDMRDKIICLPSSLSTKIKKIQMKVDKSIGQFLTGDIHWSPTIQVYRDHIDYCHHVLHIKKGVSKPVV